MKDGIKKVVTGPREEWGDEKGGKTGDVIYGCPI